MFKLNKLKPEFKYEAVISNISLCDIPFEGNLVM